MVESDYNEDLSDSILSSTTNNTGAGENEKIASSPTDETPSNNNENNKELSKQALILKLQEVNTQNGVLKRNFKNLQDEYKELHHYYEDQHEKWKDQLRDKQSEFDSLQQKHEAFSNDVDSMSRKYLEELNTRKQLEQELESFAVYKEKYNQINRDYETVKAQLKHVRKNHDQVTADMKYTYELRIQGMKRNIEDLNRKLKPVDDLKEITDNLNREIEGQQARQKELISELNDVRRQKAEVLAQKEEAVMMHSQQSAEYITTIESNKNDIDRLTNRCTSLEQKLSDAEYQYDNSAKRVGLLEKEQTRFTHENQQLRDQLRQMEQDHNRLIQMIKSDHSRHETALSSQIADLQSQNNSLQKMTTQLRIERADIEKDMQDKNRRQQQEDHERFKVLQGERFKFEQETIRLSNELKEIQRAHEHALELKQKSIDDLTTAKDRLLIEKRDQEHEMNRLQSNTTSIQSRFNQVEESRDELERQLQLVTDEKQALQQQLLEANQLHKRDTLKIDHLNGELNEMSESLKNEKHQRHTTTTQHVHQIRSLQSQLTNVSSKYSKLEKGYVSMRHRASARIRQIKEAEQELQRELENQQRKLRQALEDKRNSDRDYGRQLRQAARDREQMSMMLDQHMVASSGSFLMANPNQDDDFDAAGLNGSTADLYSTSLKHFEQLKELQHHLRDM